MELESLYDEQNIYTAKIQRISKFRLGDVRIPNLTFIAISCQIRIAVELAHRNEIWMSKAYKDVYLFVPRK